MNEKITHTLAREEDGGVQIVFTIPVSLVKSAKTKALTALGAGTEIPGFRKGKAPLDQVEAKISPQTVIEKTLQQLLPQALADAIKEANLKLAIYPRFEAIKIKDDEPWQIKAVSCEIPEITLGDYKKAVGGALRAKAIWTPGKGDKTPKEPTKEEKEQAAIAAILENVKIVIPKMLATEEVDSRLSALLERLEKLGLNLDGYLASIGKTPESLRAEYETQAKNAIALELILEKIAEEEKLKVDEKLLNDTIATAANADPKMQENLNSPEQKRLITGVLRRRASLDFLASLV